MFDSCRTCNSYTILRDLLMPLMKVAVNGTPRTTSRFMGHFIALQPIYITLRLFRKPTLPGLLYHRKIED